MMDGGIDMTSDISTSLIVVGVDGSAGSREALQWAFAYAELSGAAVQAVMAWQLRMSIQWCHGTTKRMPALSFRPPSRRRSLPTSAPT
jgi:nucleotide-binding universal stress UspA family protein